MKRIPLEQALLTLRRRPALDLQKRKRITAQRRRRGLSSESGERRDLFGPRSKVIGLLARHAFRSLAAQKRKITVKVPPVLSILDAPEDAIVLACSFARALHEGKSIRTITFHHQQLRKYDLAANALLDIVASEFEAQFKIKRSRARLRFNGYLPNDASVQRFIRAIGIIKHLGVEHEAPSKAEASQLEVFDSRQKHYSPKKKGTGAGKVDSTARRFVDHINKCLTTTKHELTPDGLNSLTEYITEILNNAEEHPGFVDWTLQGYLDQSAPTPWCEIAIFNFGRSIAESLLQLPKPCYTWDQIGPYVEMHSGKRLFSPDWREQDLITVVALQPDVSSKNETVEDSRGQGTVDLIEFFQRVYEECTNAKNCAAEMAILSGSTYIRFDGTHKLAPDEPGGRRKIAFNATNDLNERPDPNFVRPLGKLHFPGTIISIRFPLTSATLVGESENGTESDED